VSNRYRIRVRLLVRCPQHSIPVARVTHASEVLRYLLVRLAPEVGALQGARVFLEHEAGIVATNLLRHDLRDVAAATARPGDGIDERHCLLRQGDVRPDQTHACGSECE